MVRGWDRSGDHIVDLVVHKDAICHEGGNRSDSASGSVLGILGDACGWAAQLRQCGGGGLGGVSALERVEPLSDVLDDSPARCDRVGVVTGAVDETQRDRTPDRLAVIAQLVRSCKRVARA